MKRKKRGPNYSVLNKGINLEMPLNINAALNQHTLVYGREEHVYWIKKPATRT